jgi:hypothetical protein
VPLSFNKPHKRDDEINKAVEKLKRLYTKYAQEFNPRIFNLRGFEDRYRNALRDKVNLNAFLHAEILAFEELKKRVQKKTEDRSSQPFSSYGEIADRIVAENMEKVRKYKGIDFHPDAEEEATLLLGAVTEFYYTVWGNAARMLKPLGISEVRDFIEKLETDFSYFVVPVRGQYSRAVDDYRIVLSRKSPKDNEKAAVNFIKYGGILLNNCRKLFTDGLNFMQGKKEYGRQHDELTDFCRTLDMLVDDFRLGGIRGY